MDELEILREVVRRIANKESPLEQEEMEKLPRVLQAELQAGHYVALAQLAALTIVGAT